MRTLRSKLRLKDIKHRKEVKKLLAANLRLHLKNEQLTEMNARQCGIINNLNLRLRERGKHEK